MPPKGDQCATGSDKSNYTVYRDSSGPKGWLQKNNPDVKYEVKKNKCNPEIQMGNIAKQAGLPYLVQFQLIIM